jgi:mannose-1-phosphate guanylyltransferase/mannose-1-phosphate guanylyltransferase/mannose-6-phosphate isomerase
MKVLTERSLKHTGVASEQAIYEPCGKNTAPAIALLCRVFEMKGWSEKVVGIFPADHLIEDETRFQEAVHLGELMAEQGKVVTLGVAPNYPATGYGYIETAGRVAATEGALLAVGFREKPNESTAREFIARGGFYWNAGMFIFKVETMKSLLKAHVPDIWRLFSDLLPDLSNLTEIYKEVRTISIDYAVMERLPDHICIPCQFDWSDLGSWDAVAEILATKSDFINSQVSVDAKNNFVFPMSGKTYGLVGIDDVIVVDTPDALLITKKGTSERVKEVVDRLKTDSVASGTQHKFEVRPWGSFQILHDAAEFKSKTIIVDPGAQLSYQSHSKRVEHWIFVKGCGEVVLNGENVPVEAGKHVFIPVGAKHRVRNNSSAPLEFVEVQLGSYFGEDDIVRYMDDYQRGGVGE